MRGMIVQSGNDACIALAELIAGSEDAFAQQMNREAQRLGMKNTITKNVRPDCRLRSIIRRPTIWRCLQSPSSVISPNITRYIR